MEFAYLLFLVLYITTCISTTKGAIAIPEDNIVMTNDGAVQGIRDDVNNVAKFLKIPFAEPPVGGLRFKKPKKNKPWNNVLDATQLGPTCPQVNGLSNPTDPESEDCLHLNIYVPLETASEEPLAVMLYIHGGGYTWGSGVWYDGTELTTEGGVILVAINYRLDLLGFLSAGNNHLPGNMGLLDQRRAMVWVKENIAHFGGDPNRITIFGVSAGADAIAHHILSPISAGLFSRAILESPTAQFHLPKHNDVEQNRNFRDFAAHLGCDFKKSQTKKALKCLRELPVDMLKSSTHRATFPNIEADLATRVIDNRIIKGDPKKAWESGNFNNVDVIIGFNSDDGNVVARNGLSALGLSWSQIQQFGLPAIPNQPFILIDLMAQGAISFQTRERPYTVEPLLGGSDNVENAELMMTMMRHEFFRDVYANPTDKALELRAGLDVLTGGVFASYAAFVANAVATHTNNSVYMYYFSHISPNDVNPNWLLDHGAFHSIDVHYIFGASLLFNDPETEPYNEIDDAVSQSMQNAWTSFATTGVPMIDDVTTWPSYSVAARDFYHFSDVNNGQGEATSRVWDDVINFFNDIIQPVSELKESCPKKPRRG